jgi:hypothetical protein
MSDFCAEGVWSEDGAAMSPFDLPINIDLQEKLQAWNWWYDIGYEGRCPDFDIDEFSAVGLELAVELKRQLPDWTIEYFDESACDRGEDRSRYRFEVLTS